MGNTVNFKPSDIRRAIATALKEKNYSENCMSRKTTQAKYGKDPWKHTVAGGPASELIDDGEMMVFPTTGRRIGLPL